MSNEIEISVKEISILTKKWYYYFLSKWIIILLSCFLFGLLGVLYASFQKPLYTAELTFTSDVEGSGNLSSYAGIASQFGLDLGGSSSSVFGGDNLMHLMTSRLLIQKTLLTPVVVNNNKTFLINYYLRLNESKEKNKEDYSRLFLNNTNSSNRKSDSIMINAYATLFKSLTIERIDKRSDIISVTMKSTDEFFSKTFVEELVNNVIQYYTDYKVKKLRQNVAILQRQTDSIRNLINGGIVDIAVSNDLNVNPTRQIMRTGVQRKQVDAQVNGALYGELVKNLELSKLTLRKETPLIQIIDTPMYPLVKEKMGRLKGAVIFGFFGLTLTLIFFNSKKIILRRGPCSFLLKWLYFF